jgi:hypothetical protein
MQHQENAIEVAEGLILVHADQQIFQDLHLVIKEQQHLKLLHIAPIIQGATDATSHHRHPSPEGLITSDQRSLVTWWHWRFTMTPTAPPHCPYCDYAPAPDDEKCAECGYDFTSPAAL